MQFTVFWDVTPCSFISKYKRLFRAENGGSRFLRNAGTYLPSYMSSHATVPAAVKVKSRSFYFYRQTSNTTCKYRVHLLPFPRARQLYRTASLYPPAYPVTTAVLRGMIEETLYCSLGKSRHTAFKYLDLFQHSPGGKTAHHSGTSNPPLLNGQHIQPTPGTGYHQTS